MDESVYVWYSGASSQWSFCYVLCNKTSKINKDIEIYPNPSRNRFYVKIMKHPAEKIQVKIFDISGKHQASILNQQADISSITEFTTQNIETGVYFIQVEYNGGIVSQKLVIE